MYIITLVIYAYMCRRLQQYVNAYAQWWCLDAWVRTIQTPTLLIRRWILGLRYMLFTSLQRGTNYHRKCCYLNYSFAPIRISLTSMDVILWRNTYISWHEYKEQPRHLTWKD